MTGIKRASALFIVLIMVLLAVPSVAFAIEPAEAAALERLVGTYRGTY